MPTSCYVPQCTKKGYLDENGSKGSHFTFPDDQVLRKKKWIHTIRRDVGIHFQLKKWTKVCSRHFREYDFIKTFSGRRELRKNAVPSLFSWTRTSPRKRKAPTIREQFVETIVDLKTKLERANRRIESLQQQMFTVDRFRGDPSGFIVAFQTGIHSMLFLNT